MAKVIFGNHSSPLVGGESKSGFRTIMSSLKGKTTEPRGYAPINGLKMHYEIEGSGDPLVYIPPAFGYAGLKSFPAKKIPIATAETGYRPGETR